MVKKVILYVVIVFFVACGSNQNMVRTTQSKTVPSKTVVRTTKKPSIKQSSAPITKKAIPIVKKEIENKAEVNKSQLDNALVKTTSQSLDKAETSVSSQSETQIEILEATTKVKVTTAMVIKYIEKYKEIAKQDMLEYGIPASITLGQGILESGAGTGPLSAMANNHFGIKCHKEWLGPSVRYNDDEENECFRKYSDPSESYKDHSLFLITRPHYSSLFQLDKTDYKSWAKGLKNAGYATDPAYPIKLIAIIERYQLQKFDYEVLGRDYVSSNNSIVDKNTNENTSYSSHQVTKGDTLYSISKKYNVTIQDLKKKNNISNDTLSIGQSLIIN